MNRENGRFIGIGVALVDYVFKWKNQEVPSTRDEVLPYIATRKPDLIRAGGPMPNTFVAISRLSTNRKLKLFHCVGADERGDFFSQRDLS